MKTTSTLFSLAVVAGINAQIATTTIQHNDVSAFVTDAGIFFNNMATGMHGYEVPKNTTTHLIYSSAFWFGGVDVNGNLKLAAQDMYGGGADLWPGALTVGAAEVVSPNPLGQTLWSVAKSEIEQHQLDYQQPGYVVPLSIASWPAHGDVTSGQSYYLAPFVDVNLDGDYNPELGDYPCIKGDYAAYTIMNDKGGVHASGGEPIGIEVHFMFYQFSTADDLNNTTFIDVTLFNRGTQTLEDFTTSYIMDGDLGGYDDDYVGCDSTRNLIYQYNGDDMDASTGGATGYGANPPSFGVVSLNNKLTNFGYFTNSAVFPYGSPSTAAQTWYCMTGRWQDGAQWLDHNSDVTNFHFYDNPNDPAGWSELTDGNAPGDRRTIMSVGTGVLAPNDKLELSYAVVYNRTGDHLENVDGLLSVTDDIQAYFDAQIDGLCPVASLGLDDLENELTFEVNPNPSSGSFQVLLNSKDDYSVSIVDMSGREQLHAMYKNSDQFIVQLDAPAGVYFLRIESDTQQVTKKIMIR